MSSNALFGNDSSDEEEETPAVTSQEKAKDDEPKKADKPAIADDSDSDDDDDDGGAKSMDVDGGAKSMDVDGEEKTSESKEGEESKEDAEKEAKKKAQQSLFGESDEESDEEFDDKGAIEGASAPAAQDSSGPGDAQSKSSNKPPENATVLYASRPDDGVTMHMTKLPNLVAIQPSAFEESKYDGQEEEEQYKGYVHNMIRWRYKKNESGEFERDASGALIRESNTKLVKWEDGSYTIHIGDESFVVQTVDHQESGSTAQKSFIYLSQKATYSNDDDGEAGNGGTMLECVGGVTSRLIPKPSSLQSEAHKSLTVAVRQKTMKRAKIAEYVTQEDPEKLRADRIRTNQEEDKIRARKSSEYRSGSRGGFARRRKPGMNRGYMEADDDGDYETTDIGGIKKGTIEDDMSDYGDESDESDGYNDATFRNRNRKRQKRALEEEDEDEEELVFDDDDDDDEVAVKAPTKKRATHQAVLDDDSD